MTSSRCFIAACINQHRSAARRTPHHRRSPLQNRRFAAAPGPHHRRTTAARRFTAARRWIAAYRLVARPHRRPPAFPQLSVIAKRHADRHAERQKRHAGVMRTSQFQLQASCGHHNF
jgi:hypothetical protein